ncbi:DUF541 domain-containing protein [bacterium]|nr:DUF541 domain-containing protein [bacterium]
MPSNSSSFWPQWDDQPVFTVLLALLLAAGVVWAGASAGKAIREVQRVGYSEQMSPSISVNAEGTAVVKNDIGTVDIGITKTASTATEVQTTATEAMNALTNALRQLGIPSEDLQTSSYNVYPQYDYNNSPAQIVGYEASQMLTVKVRNSELVSSVLGKAGEMGATNISSLRFEADDDTQAVQEAREEAIDRAREQAQATADAMGARLGEVISYSESRGDMGYPYAHSYAEAAIDSAMGGVNPSVQMGQGEVQLYVYLTYSIE